MTTPFPFVAGSVLPAQSLNDITNLPINDQTASYTLVVGDAGKRVVMNVASANTVTVNDSVFTTGDTIFVANKGAGASTLTAGAGVTINSASGLVLVAHQSGQLVALSASSFLFVLSAVTASSGAVVQVKSTTKTDTFTTTSNTFVDVTGVSVTITPTSATNKILILLDANLAGNSSFPRGQILQDSTAVGIGDTAGVRGRVGLVTCVVNTAAQTQAGYSFLDSPATTSAITYKLQLRTDSAAAIYVNRAHDDSDTTARSRAITTITVMEVTP